MAMESASRIMSGTWGELWLDDEYVSEIFKFQAKATLNKEEVAQCGELWTDHKVKSVTGKGSMGLYKANSRMAKKLADAILAGKDPRCKIVAKLGDPDAVGTERVAVHNVSFDDLTLADWEAAVIGKVECPFTFRKYQYIDMAG